MTMKKRDGGWWGNQQRSDKKDSREIRKKKRKICKKEITTKKKFGSLNERKSCFFLKKLKILSTQRPLGYQSFILSTHKKTHEPPLLGNQAPSIVTQFLNHPLFFIQKIIP
jgi:hypothetical protein